MENKRYYWIKLKHSFYESNEAIDFLLTQPDGHGAEYVVLYQMLCLKTANNNGALYSQMGEIIVPYDVDKITRDCKYFERYIVTNALLHYKKLGLIYEEKDSGYLVISDIKNMIGSESESAERVRKHRNKEKALHCNDCVTENVTKNVTTDIEIDIEKELEIEKESEIDTEIDINKKQAASNAHAHAREEPPPAKANKAKEEFFKAFPFVRLNGANDSGIDYEKLLTAFREGNDYLQNTKSMNYITAHYAEIIGGGYRRADKPATQQEPKKTVEQSKYERELWYRERREAATRVAQENIKKARTLPNYEETVRELNRIKADISGANECGDEAKAKQLAQRFKTENDKLNGILAAGGIERKSLYPQWHCAKCSDTGYLPSGHVCDCYAGE